jgi:Flp pilus assembly protein TadB
MAQTKRKRQTKHRGNAAGIIETRGRTGRSLKDDPKKAPKLARQDREPSWRSAFYRAMIATVALLLIAIFLIKNSNKVIGLFPIVLALYTAIGYYTDTLLYKRRQRQKAAGKVSS